MKYAGYTLIIFFVALLQSSLASSVRFLFPYINILYIILFAYYLSRKNGLSLYLFFIGGVFLDILTLSQIGSTSADFFISLLIFTLLSMIFPAERLGKVISVGIASIGFSIISYITLNFLANNSIKGILFTIPWAIINALLILGLNVVIETIKPAKKESKIRID